MSDPDTADLPQASDAEYAVLFGASGALLGLVFGGAFLVKLGWASFGNMVLCTFFGAVAGVVFTAWQCWPRPLSFVEAARARWVGGKAK